MDIYPAIDLKGGHCVRLSQGQFEQVTTYSEDPVKIAKKWKAAGAQWLHIVDLDGARTGSPSTENLNIVRQIIRQVGVPVQFGGGVRSASIVERMVGIGVTRVVVGTAAIENAQLAQGLFTAYGDRVAVGVDAKDGLVALHGWQQTSGESAPQFVVRMAALGAKRFIYTDIGRDGMLQGVNIPSLRQVAAAVPNLPVIASGGVAGIADIETLVLLQREYCANVSGVIIGKALYAGTVTLEDVLKRAAAG
jgi:phosphoribosylformimino-5-aminoimidazole carboxamide ribotide isomerase